MCNRKLFRLCFVFISILSFASCGGIRALNRQGENHIQDAVKYLTSNLCDGRLPGTSGNKEAEKYIEKTLEENEISKYLNRYTFKYEHSRWKIINENYEMTIKFNNGELYKCILGEDFFPNYMTNVDLKCSLTFDINDENMKNSVVAIESGKGELSKVKKTAKAVLIKSESFKNNVPVYFENEIPYIQVSSDLYDNLKNKSVMEVRIKFNVKAIEERISQNNVVGIIPGENHKNAIVVSSHFDHVGSRFGKTWVGAMDNASGTSVTIDIAKRLKQLSKEIKFKDDIIICFFNGEESNFQGSNAFVDSIKNKYGNIYNINIDCVGIKNGGDILLCGEKEISGDLINVMKKYFEKGGLTVKEEFDLGMSDHCSFISNNISAVGIFQEGYSNISHTLNDNINNIDFEYLDKVSETIVSFITENSGKTFNERAGVLKNIANEEEVMNDEKAKLKYNQCKFININNQIKVIEKNSTCFQGDNEIAEFTRIYPELGIEKKLGEYTLDTITVANNCKRYIENPKINEIYTKKGELDSIVFINFCYIRNKGLSNESKFCIYINKYDNNEQYKNADLKKEYAKRNKVLDNETINLYGDKFMLVHNKNDKSINGMLSITKKNDKIMHVEICSDDEKKWPYNTKKLIMKAYDDLELKTFVKNILVAFKM